MPISDVVIRGAREHNLRNVDLVLPRNQLPSKSAMQDVLEFSLISPNQAKATSAERDSISDISVSESIAPIESSVADCSSSLLKDSWMAHSSA